MNLECTAKRRANLQEDPYLGSARKAPPRAVVATGPASADADRDNGAGSFSCRPISRRRRRR